MGLTFFLSRSSSEYKLQLSVPYRLPRQSWLNKILPRALCCLPRRSWL